MHRFWSMFVVCILMLLANSSVQGELFTSTSHMASLVESHSQITQILQDYVDYHQNALDKASLLLEDFEKITELSKPDAEKFIGNPVNAFLLIKKLTKDVQQFVETVNTFQKLLDTINVITESYTLPTDEDYNGAILAIHRLEDTYLLEPKDVRSGKLSEHYPSRGLTPFECFEFGRVALEENDTYHAMRWLSEAFDLVQLEIDEETGTNDELLKTYIDITYYLSIATARQGNLKHALDLTEHLFEIDPKHEKAKENLVVFKKDLEELSEKYRAELESTEGDDSLTLRDPFAIVNPKPYDGIDHLRDAYESLCRGEPTHKKTPSSSLTCYYAQHDYQLLIAPVKVEILATQPAIWFYHDVITDAQINAMKHLAYPKLERARVEQDLFADMRISKNGWLYDEDHPSLVYLTRLISSLTNLSMTTAEPWQIANYGIGGQYEPHHDYFKSIESMLNDKIGNRIATWLYYLESPEQGGFTVFPNVDVYVKPKRRAAVFWHNLLPSGNGDLDTLHAACPVLIGNKWVSNKWIHEVGQEFRRPCELAPV